MFRKYLDSIVTISLLLFIIVNPLISSKTFPLGGGLIWILIYLSYLLIAFAREKPTFYYKTAFNFPILFFLSVLLANQFFSINHYNSLTELAHFISYILLFFVVVYASSKNKTKLIAAIMISGTIIAMYSVYQYYFGISNTLKIITQMPPSGTQSLVYAQDFLMFKRAFATFFSPDKLSAFLLYIVFISLGVSTTDSIDLRLKYSTLLFHFGFYYLQSLWVEY